MIDPVAFIDELKRLPGALEYNGDASCQVCFYLHDGSVLRIGSTDADVGRELWADKYDGLNGEVKRYFEQMENGHV